MHWCIFKVNLKRKILQIVIQKYIALTELKN
jgi:hypothetical protein